MATNQDQDKEQDLTKDGGSRLFKLNPFTIEFLAGWFGGVGNVLAAQPFDIVKIRMQTQNTGEIQKKLYRNPFDCVRRIVKEEGFFTLYKGSLSPLIAIGTIVAVEFWAYSKAKSIIKIF